MADTKNIHEGHRDRLRDKFLANGFAGFEHHNILELLLFYSIPRKDTNEIAHELLNHFGSLKNVFEAEYEELIKVKGITKNSATLIKMVPKIFKEYVEDALKDTTNAFDNIEKIGRFFINKYIGEKKELVYAMLLNNKFELLNVFLVHEGSVNSASISTRKVVDMAFKYNAPMVVLAHNHPDGLACPSTDDMNTTADMLSLLKSLDITLVEHVLVAGNQYYPIVEYTKSLNKRNLDKNSAFRSSLDLKF